MAQNQSPKLHSPQPQRQALISPCCGTNLFPTFQLLDDEDQVSQEISIIINHRLAITREKQSTSPGFRRNCAMSPERNEVNPLVFDEEFVVAGQAEELLSWDSSISTP
jgi:hypothetical protein